MPKRSRLFYFGIDSANLSISPCFSRTDSLASPRSVFLSEGAKIVSPQSFGLDWLFQIVNIFQKRFAKLRLGRVRRLYLSSGGN